MGANAAAITFPNATEDSFAGIVDVILEKYITYEDDLGVNRVLSDVPAELKDKLKQYRHTLIERLADADDEIADKFLEEKEISVEDIKKAIRRATIKGTFLPVLCGSSLKNKGVQLVLDAVCDYLPSPLDVPPVKGIDPATKEEITRPPSADAPLSALVFKIATDPYVGEIVLYAYIFREDHFRRGGL